MDAAIGQSSHYGLVRRNTNSLACACDGDVEFRIAVALPVLSVEVLSVHLVIAPTLLQCGVDNPIRESLAAAYVQVRFGIVHPEKRG